MGLDFKDVLSVINPVSFAPLQLDRLRGGGEDPSVQAGSLTSEEFQDIVSRINSGAGRGTYGEGIIASGFETIRDLRDRWQSGDISSSDYLAINDAVMPQLLDAVNRLASSGKKPAEAAWAAGGLELNKFGADYNILKSASQILGREITPQDIDEFRPFFEGGETEGRAYLAELAKQEARSPAALRARAGEFAEPVGDIFQQLLNRGASEDELEYFGSLLASGDVSEFELGQFVRQLPEFRTAEDKRFREGLASELEEFDLDFFNKARKDVTSQFLRQGLGTSSALDNALTDLMGDIAKERGRYLAGLSAQQFGGNKALAREDYLNTLNQFIGERQFRRGRSEGIRTDLLGRSREVADYNRQFRDYMDSLSRLPSRRRNSLGPLASLAGFGAGAATGNPYWALAGGQFGQTGGNVLDFYLNN